MKKTQQDDGWIQISQNQQRHESKSPKRKVEDISYFAKVETGPTTHDQNENFLNTSQVDFSEDDHVSISDYTIVYAYSS